MQMTYNQEPAPSCTETTMHAVLTRLFSHYLDHKHPNGSIDHNVRPRQWKDAYPCI
jgi:hypothetical protein